MLVQDINRCNYEKDIIPFLRNGIIIDTSIIDTIIQGHIATRISKKKPEELTPYSNILTFFDLVKVQNRWEKFLITPHILAEVCRHFRDKYSKWGNYSQLVHEAFPILENMEEKFVSKEDFLKYIDKDNPVIEAGDISIYVTADDFIQKDKRVALLADDRGVVEKYQDHPRILVFEYQSIVLNSL